MNFIILGAGAIGCYVGGRLAAAGQHVTLVGRPRTIEPIALGGLTVTDMDGFSVHLTPRQLLLSTSLPEAWLQHRPQGPYLANSDGETVILLCVKGGATDSAAQEIAACCPAGTAVVSLQNGVDNLARITHAAPLMKAIPGMVPYNVVMPQAGAVHRATSGSLHLARNSTTEQMAPILFQAGLPTELADDMRAVQWGKLLLNLNNPINALSNLPLREQLLDRDYRCVLAALQTEALAAMDSAGIRPAKVTSAPPRALPHLLRLPNWLFKRAAARMLQMDASARSSMWDDLQHGRTTEIDDLCGAVVRLAQRNGSQAPRNAAMCQLLGEYKKDMRWTGAALRQSLSI
jgi:2-dehydropantoate 2-reductase